MNTQARSDHFDQWLQQVNQACGAFGARTLGSAFNGALREHRASALRMSFVDVAQAQLYRGVGEIARNDCDHYYACFQLQGQARMEQGDHQASLESGDIVLIDSARPSNFVYGDGSRQLSLILPRQLVQQSVQFAEIRCGQRIHARSPVALLANPLVAQAAGLQCLSHAEGEAVLMALIGLLRPAISAADVDEEPHERLFRKALRFVDEHIREETLCPELLAREVGVSVRGLYRMFSKKGMVVAQYIKNRRLDFCAESLRHLKAEQKLSALGYTWGFSDSSHFSTAFKSRFGVSPGEYRKRYQPNPGFSRQG